ncbi:MAG: neutral zinc metallopeptidase [Thermomicrobiales bacterium]
MVRVRVLVATLVLIFAVSLVPPQAGAQSMFTGRAGEAAEAARQLSRLEADEAFDELYERIHPDAAEVVPEEAVVGWYEAEFAAKRTAELTVTGVEFVTWTWPVSGESYRQTAAVSFVQPYWDDGVRTEVVSVVHLVEADGEWGWFFGNDRAFVALQIANAGLAPSLGQGDGYVSSFADILHADVDEFWYRTFSDVGLGYTPPSDIVGFDAPINTACGAAEPATTAAFYCTVDETIYYSTGFRQLVDTQVGDFAWVTVIAHEWAHHIQTGLGLQATTRPDLTGGPYVIELELQADCLAGVYAEDAEARSWLDPGDLDEALTLTRAVGDPAGTEWSDPAAHGTSRQRLGAFASGYEEGVRGCELSLT